MRLLTPGCACCKHKYKPGAKRASDFQFTMLRHTGDMRNGRLQNNRGIIKANAFIGGAVVRHLRGVFLSAAIVSICLVLSACGFKGGVNPPPHLNPLPLVIRGVAFNPEKAAYNFGDTFTITVDAEGGGVLSYEWTFGEWAETDGDLTSASETVTCLAVYGRVNGSITVTQTISGESLSSTYDFDITIAAPPGSAPVVTDIIRSGADVFASFTEPDGDDFTISWESSEWSIGAVGNTEKTAHARLPSDGSPPAALPVEADVTCAVTDEFGLTGTMTKHILFAENLIIDADYDSLVLYVDTPIVMQGEEIRLHLYSEPAEELAGCTVRLLVDKSTAQATSISIGDFFDGYDGAAIISPASLQQPDFLEVSISFGGGTTENAPGNNEGTLFDATFLALKPGGVIFGIDTANTQYYGFPDTPRGWQSNTAVVNGVASIIGYVIVLE